MNPLTIAVIWSRFGPYHLARLRGAAQVLPTARIVGLEVAGNDREYAWERALGADGFERITIFANSNYHDLPSGEIAIGVHQALDRLSPTAVAINGWSVPEARAALSWTRRSGARAILMTESKADDRARMWWKEAAKRAIVWRFDAALVGGQQQAEYLKSLGYPSDRIRFGYDAVDNDYFESGSDAARLNSSRERARLALPDFYFFACTRFLGRKNVDGLLRGYAQYAAKSAKPWKLVIAGSGEEEARLRQLARLLGVAENIVWPGFVQYGDLPAYFGLAGAFIHPAKSEAWGLVVNEAAASATPLLVSRSVGAAATLVRERETGLLFNPHDDGDIARVLSEVAHGACPRDCGINARKVVANWGPQRFGEELGACAGFSMINAAM